MSGEYRLMRSEEGKLILKVSSLEGIASHLTPPLMRGNQSLRPFEGWKLWSTFMRGTSVGESS